MPVYRTTTHAGSVSTYQILSYWLKFVDGLDWRKGNLNHAENEAFIRAVSLRIDQHTAVETVAEKILAAGDSPKYQKLEREFESACFYAGHGVPLNSSWSKENWTKHKAEPEAVFDLAYLENFTAPFTDTVDETYLEARSQYKPAGTARLPNSCTRFSGPAKASGSPTTNFHARALSGLTTATARTLPISIVSEVAITASGF
jgi:hypothetical protein